MWHHQRCTCIAVLALFLLSSTRALLVSTCDSSRVRITVLPLSTIASPCGSQFQFVVNATSASRDSHSNCPFTSVPNGGGSPVGAKVCDSNRERCVSCSKVALQASGLLFTCVSAETPGTQVITAYYRYGPLEGSISTNRDFGCDATAPFTSPPHLDCRSSDVRISLLPGARFCGAPFQVLLNATADNRNCPFAPKTGLVLNGGATGASVCDPLQQACIACLDAYALPGAGGLLVTCAPTNKNGMQTITVGYQYGALSGTIAVATTFSGCAPTPRPPSFPRSTFEPTCNPGFYLAQGPRQCGQVFQAVMYSTYGVLGFSDRIVPLDDDRCVLSSSGAQICDATLGRCAPCTRAASNPDIVFDCLPVDFNGVQIVIANFAFSGTASHQSGDVREWDSFSGCSTPQCTTSG